MSTRKYLRPLITVIKLYPKEFQSQPHTLVWTTRKTELHPNIKGGTSLHNAFHFGFSSYSVETFSAKLVKYGESSLITTMIQNL